MRWCWVAVVNAWVEWGTMRSDMMECSVVWCGGGPGRSTISTDSVCECVVRGDACASLGTVYGGYDKGVVSVCVCVCGAVCVCVCLCVCVCGAG